MLRFACLIVIAVVACTKDTGLPPPASGSAAATTAAPAGTPSGHGGMMPQKTAPHAPDKLANGRTQLGPFTAEVPADWTVKPVTSNMRVADYVIGADDAELVIYYFGQGGAGTLDANLDRWFGQFQQPDGKPTKDVAKIEKTKFAGQDATVVSASGHYHADPIPGMGTGQPVDKADQALLATIVGSPAGPYYFKLVGNKKTIDANAAKFRAMLTSLELH
jgi:hypothetical protein